METCRPGYEKWSSKDVVPPSGCDGRVKKIPLSSFTWPNNPDALDYVAAAYSLTPIFVILVACIYGIYRKTISAAAFILMFLFHHPFTSTLKMIFRENRPFGSCSNSCGMPSGHSFMAISTLTFFILRFSLARPAIAILAFFFFAPVPWARVQLKDHSISQVIVGASLGVLWGILWALLQPKLTQLLSQLIRIRMH